MDSDNTNEPETAISLASRLIEDILKSSPSDLQKLQELIEAGAALWFQQTDGGLSALHAACLVENPELVQFLVDNGAVWNSG